MKGKLKMNKVQQIKKQIGKRTPFSFRKRLRSINYAIEGVGSFFKSEHNAWIHLVATMVVIMLGLVYRVSAMEVAILALCIGFVWSAEIFNTSIEKTMDLISTEKDPMIKRIKDLSAAAVLIAAITALVVGCIVFIPKL